MSGFLPNEFIAFNGINELSKLSFKGDVDLSRKVDILLGFLEKLNPNSENFVNKMNAIFDRIDILENKNIRNKTLCFQGMLEINNFNPEIRNVSKDIPNIGV